MYNSPQSTLKNVKVAGFYANVRRNLFKIFNQQLQFTRLKLNSHVIFHDRILKHRTFNVSIGSFNPQFFPTVIKTIRNSSPLWGHVSELWTPE